MTIANLPLSDKSAALCGAENKGVHTRLINSPNYTEFLGFFLLRFEPILAPFAKIQVLIQLEHAKLIFRTANNGEISSTVRARSLDFCKWEFFRLKLIWGNFHISVWIR